MENLSRYYATHDPELPPGHTLGVRLQVLVEVDSLLRTLVYAESALLMRLAEVVDGLGQGQHRSVGYSGWVDYCRERLDLRAHELGRLRRLARGLKKFPIMRSEFRVGHIHRGHVDLLIPYLNQHPDEEGVRVEQATRMTLHQLKETLGIPVDPELLARRTFLLTPTQAEMWAEIFELARRVAGADISAAEVLEMLAAEFLQVFSEPDIQVDVPDLRRLPDQRAVEESMERRYRFHDFLDPEPRRMELLEVEIPPDAEGKERLALELVDAHRLLNVAIGRLLWLLSDVYEMPAFATLKHYATQRLGMCDSTARQLVARERRMRRRPELRQAVLDGRLSLSHLDQLLPLMDRGANPATWIAYASQVTCENLEAWSRSLKLLAETSPACWERWKTRTPKPGQHPRDALAEGRRTRQAAQVRASDRLTRAWLETGQARRVMEDVAVLSVAHPLAGMNALVFEVLACQILSEEESRIRLSFRLSPEVYTLVVKAEVAAQDLTDEPLSRGDRLQCLMHAFVLAHQDCGFRGQRKRLLERDDFRCAVPGCTCRQHLQAHHIKFRSQGGGNEDFNVIYICWGCHRLVHDGLLIIRGLAGGRVVFRRRNGELFIGEFRSRRGRTSHRTGSPRWRDTG
ncbi:MAG: HNH endonuclease [Candidatus Eremiobacterota bacterium]